MDEINWEDRLIGIKGSRGVGKTTFLLDYAREYFGADNKECLYINLNHFYFTERTLVDFAAEFRAKGGKVLLIDQVFKYSNWSRELRYCYDNFEDLKIVFSGSSVMRLKEENPDLSGKVVSYNLRGFSFREFLNLMSGNQFSAYTFDEVVENHQEIAKRICSVVRPMAYFQDYLHHGFYPFFLESALLRESAEDHEHDARGGRVIHKTNRTKLPTKATQTTLLIGYERSLYPKRESVEQGYRDIPGHRDELYQVFDGCPFDEYAVSGGRILSEETLQGIYV